jgi:hypothetical protein
MRDGPSVKAWRGGDSSEDLVQDGAGCRGLGLSRVSTRARDIAPPCVMITEFLMIDYLLSTAASTRAAEHLRGVSTGGSPGEHRRGAGRTCRVRAKAGKRRTERSALVAPWSSQARAHAWEGVRRRKKRRTKRKGGGGW